MTKHLLIWLKPSRDDIPDPPAMHLLGQLAPGYVRRIVRSQQQLAEKILARDANLDDRVIEVMKIVAWYQQFGDSEPPPDGFCFVGVRRVLTGRRLIFAVITEAAEWQTVEVRLSDYNSTASQLAPFLVTGPEGAWHEVDRRYALQFADRVLS